MTQNAAHRTRGIRTRYRATSFRSRLESRWAAFFDIVDWRWTYEPFDAQGWIPDFLIAGAAPFLVEVGPCIQLSEFSAKAAKALAAYPAADGQPPERITLVLGAGPLVLGFDAEPVDSAAGYMTDDGFASGTDLAFWTYCAECLHLAVWHGSGARKLWPCGHPGRLPAAVSERNLADIWARAGNSTQWRGPRRDAA